MDGFLYIIRYIFSWTNLKSEFRNIINPFPYPYIYYECHAGYEKGKGKKNNRTKNSVNKAITQYHLWRGKYFRSEPLINTLPPVAKRDENNSPPQCKKKWNRCYSQLNRKSRKIIWPYSLNSAIIKYGVLWDFILYFVCVLLYIPFPTYMNKIFQRICDCGKMEMESGKIFFFSPKMQQTSEYDLCSYDMISFSKIVIC